MIFGSERGKKRKWLRKKDYMSAVFMLKRDISIGNATVAGSGHKN